MLLLLMINRVAELRVTCNCIKAGQRQANYARTAVLAYCQQLVCVWIAAQASNNHKLRCKVHCHCIYTSACHRPAQYHPAVMHIRLSCRCIYTSGCHHKKMVSHRNTSAPEPAHTTRPNSCTLVDACVCLKLTAIQTMLVQAHTVQHTSHIHQFLAAGHLVWPGAPPAANTDGG